MIANLMTRRDVSAPNLEIVPRDGPLTRLRSDAREETVEAKRFGSRLQKLYAPCTEPQDEMKTLIVALDSKLKTH
jgi:hypothetical protein